MTATPLPPEQMTPTDPELARLIEVAEIFSKPDERAAYCWLPDQEFQETKGTA